MKCSVRRWTFALLIVAIGHLAVFAAIAWHARQTPPGVSTPAILIDLPPASAALERQKEDLAPGPHMQQAETPVQDTPPPDTDDSLAPTPPQQNPAVAVPPDQKPQPAQRSVDPRPVREAIKKPNEKPAAPKTTAAPKAERQAQTAAATGTAAAAATATYREILAAHLQRFKQYPSAARAAREQGTAILSFSVGRSGQLLGSRIGRSSGYPSLDSETLAMIRRAQPLPAFPADIKVAAMSFNIPITYEVH